jgi:hypothetical protein
MSDKIIHDHPAHKHALLGGPRPRRRASYYLQVLEQNLHHFYDQVPANPCEVDEQEVLRGTVFMTEEALEYSGAKTLEGKLDALVDIVIVALGRAAFHGFHHFDEAMTRVVAANMDKVPGPSPSRGEWSRDLSKPEGWRPAWLFDLVQPSRIADSACPSDEPLNMDEIEILEGFRRRCASKSTSEIEFLVRERERLINAAETHEQKENLAARVITDLRENVADLTTERDQSNLDWGVMSDRLIQVTIEKDDFQAERDAARIERDGYQRQLQDEISRCHELRDSRDNLRKWAKALGWVDTGKGPTVERADAEKPPTAIDEIHPILLECAQLLNRKGQDYGNQDHTKERYHPLGHHSYIQMMHNKMTRIRHTALELKPGQTLNFDSVKDSVLDLINYSAFYGAWLEELEETDDNGSQQGN